MDRLVPTLLVFLIVAITGLGVVIWRADHHARENARQLICLERAHTTASIALLAPAGRVDKDGRVNAVRVLGELADAC